MDAEATARKMAEALARADGLEYVIRMPENERVVSDDFKWHVEVRMNEARRLLAAIQAMAQ